MSKTRFHHLLNIENKDLKDRNKHVVVDFDKKINTYLWSTLDTTNIKEIDENKTERLSFPPNLRFCLFPLIERRELSGGKYIPEQARFWRFLP